MRTSGMTLLELLILLTIVLGIVLVALPTLRPVQVDNLEAFARDKLRYIYEKERSYFLRNGKYDRFSVLASNESGGPYLDRRFIGDEYMERGIVFSGPSAPTADLLLEARLPGGTRITVDSKGNFKTHKSKPDAPPGTEPPGLLDEMMNPGAFPGADGGQPPAEGAAPPPPKAGPQQPVPPAPPKGREPSPELLMPGEKGESGKRQIRPLEPWRRRVVSSMDEYPRSWLETQPHTFLAGKTSALLVSYGA